MAYERTPKGDFISGKFVPVNDPNGEIQSRNPGNLDLPATPYPFSFESVQESIAAARRSFSAWKRMTLEERTGFIERYKKALLEKKEALAQAVVFESGKPLWEARQEIEAAVELIDYHLADNYPYNRAEEKQTTPDGARAVVRYRPRGVAVGLIPASVPVWTSHHFWIPSVLQGNTLVLKFSRHTPWVAQTIAEIIHEVAFPAGAVNVVQGDSEMARRLVSTSEVDIVYYSGTFETALKIKKQTVGDYAKTLVFFTGGKNPILLWQDCDYEKAIQCGMLSAFLTSGQNPYSTAHLLVHEKILDRFLTDFHQLAKKCKVGYGLAEGKETPLMGPLTSERSLENFLRYQGIAVREGCEELMRGKALDRPEKGYYVSPSIHLVKSLDPKSVYQTSETLGPDVAIYPVKDLGEAVEIIQMTKSGLSASVFCREKETFLRLADEITVGNIHWNRTTTWISPNLPTTGLRRSGSGLPAGSFSYQVNTFPAASLEADQVVIPKTCPELA